MNNWVNYVGETIDVNVGTACPPPDAMTTYCFNLLNIWFWRYEETLFTKQTLHKANIVHKTRTFK